MYEKFTDRARKIMQLANEEAQRFNHEYIGTEHVLLALIREGSGVAANVLNKLGVDLRRVRWEVEKLLQSGPDVLFMGKLPQTPRTKKVIEYAIEEARALNHNYVGSEHLLLGLIREQREQESIATIVLAQCGVTLEAARSEVLALLGHGIPCPPKMPCGSAMPCSPELPCPSEPEWAKITEGERTRSQEQAAPQTPQDSPVVCPHCGRPYRTKWSLHPVKLLRRLLGR